VGNSLFAWQNAVKTATLSATSANPVLPVANIAGDQGSPSAGWQTVAGVVAGVVLTITPAVRITFRTVGVFRTNLTAAAVMTVKGFTNPGLVQVWSDVTPAANGQALDILAADTAADVVTVQLDDAGNPDGFLNVPLAYAGPAWIPASSLSFASTLGRDSLTDTVQTRGGQTYVNLRATLRRWEIATDGVRVNELYAQLDVLDKASRNGANVLAVPDITSATAKLDALFGVLLATGDFGFFAPDRRSWRARLTERL
jgi:hypothetical protein